MKLITLDPTGHYQEQPHIGVKAPAMCMTACGLLPQFAIGPNASVADNMEHNYQYHNGWTVGGEASIDERGVWSYPGDPDMYPIAKIVGDEEVKETVYIYPHAIVGVAHDGKLVKWTRMD